MRRFPLFARIGLPLAIFVLTSAIARGEEPLVRPPPLNEAVLGPDAVKEIQAYLDQMVPVFDALDKIVNSPPEMTEVSAKFDETCSAMTDALLRARSSATKKLGGQPLPAEYETWFAGQETAWAFTGERGAQAALLVALFNADIKDWEKSWIPALKTKKKEYIGLGKELNAAYKHLEGSASIRSEEGWKKDAEAFKKTLTLAENVGRDLRNLRSRTIDRVAEEVPGKKMIGEWSALLAVLKVPPVPLPMEEIWPLHFKTWEAKLVERMKKAVEVFGEVLKETDPIRTQTLFKGVGEPIEGLHFSKIEPTWHELYDRLLKEYAEIQERVAAEEERWDADRERLVELANEDDAAEERELKLKSARTNGASRKEEIEKQYARDTGADVYEKLFRRMVEDKEYSYSEMQKRATPAFLAEWKKVEDQAAARRRESLEQVEEDMKEVEDELKEFEDRRRVSGEEFEKIKKDNARRRKELGLVEKPFVKESLR